MDSGWEQLKCRFFTSIAISVFHEPFENLGLVEQEVTIDGGVAFRSKHVEVEVTYVPETSPRYVINVLLRVRPSTRAVPLWYLAGDNGRWVQQETFSNPDQLRELLEKVVTNALTKYVVPLVIDVEQLRERINQFSRKQGLPPE